MTGTRRGAFLLARGGRRIAHDQRGHGRSTWSGDVRHSLPSAEE
ncbi:hypothetical protein ACI799_01105 [Blastococcus sp. SYSU DS0753]